MPLFISWQSAIIIESMMTDDKDPVSLAKDHDKFVLRLPFGMRDRIKKSADRNGRSMNAEIIQALEQMFPSQPSIEEVLDRIHHGIALAQGNHIPYRQRLVDALTDLSEMLETGIEFDQFRSKTIHPSVNDHFSKYYAALTRLKKASERGVETSDLERELKKGLLHRLSQNDTQNAIHRLHEGKRETAMRIMRLDDVKFRDPDAAFAAIERDLVSFYEENWGDPEELILPDDF